MINRYVSNLKFVFGQRRDTMVGTSAWRASLTINVISVYLTFFLLINSVYTLKLLKVLISNDHHSSTSFEHWYSDRPGFLNFNHGGFGATPLLVREAQSGFVDQQEAQPTAWFASGGDGAPGALGGWNPVNGHRRSGRYGQYGKNMGKWWLFSDLEVLKLYFRRIFGKPENW